jgi:hypothetical protein
MPSPRPGNDLRSPPSSFDEIVDWLEGWSYALVLLESYALTDLRAAITAVESAVRAHREVTEPWVAPLIDADEETSRTARVVLHDHAWFVTSLEQFEWFFRVVEGENHGGHRQALGQYGRVLAEALRRHRCDERWLEAKRTAPPRHGVP